MSVSRDSVVWAYRLFLDREPESEQAIAHHVEAKDSAQLRSNFLGSTEFSERLQPLKVETVPLSPAPIDVEFSATSAQLQACLTRIKQAWVHLGLKRPHFSVLSQTKFLPEHLVVNLDAFWESGMTDAAIAADVLARYGIKTLSDKDCVEYGSGVGRVTMALARMFKHVDAYDISSAHLDLARQRAKHSKVHNISFHECSSSVLPDLARCDFFYSHIVLQHNPPPVILELIRRALVALRPGGLALFQVPTYITGYRFQLHEWLAAEHALDMQMHCLPQHVIFSLATSCGCTMLEVREDDACGDPAKYLSNVFVVRKEVDESDASIRTPKTVMRLLREAVNGILPG